MQQELISNFNQFGKNVVSSVREFTDINGRLAGKVLESQIGLAKIFVETSAKQVDAAEAINSPVEYVNKQTALVEELSEKISDATKNSVSVAKEANLELKSWFEKGIKAADEAVKDANHSVATAVVSKASPAPVAKKAPAAKKPAVKAKATAKSSANAKPKVAAKTKTPAKKAPVKKASATAKKPVAATKIASASKTVTPKAAAPKKAASEKKASPAQAKKVAASK